MSFMNRHIVALAALLALATPALAQAKTCPIEKAVYRLKGFEKTASLRFVKDPAMARQTQLSGVLSSNVTGRTYKFYIAVSNGYSTHYLIDANHPKSQTDDDDKGDVNDETPSYAFYSFDSALRVMNLPNPGERAPAYVFIPDIGASLWYSEMGPDQKTREAIETQMWQRAECVK